MSVAKQNILFSDGDVAPSACLLASGPDLGEPVEPAHQMVLEIALGIQDQSCRVAVGGWRLAVGGPLGRSLRALLNKKKSSPLRTPLCPMLRLSHGTSWWQTLHAVRISGIWYQEKQWETDTLVGIPLGRDALEGGPRGGWTGGWRRLPKRLGGDYCRLQMPLRLALGVRGTVAGHRLGAPEGGGGASLSFFDFSMTQGLKSSSISIFIFLLISCLSQA